VFCDVDRQNSPNSPFPRPANPPRLAGFHFGRVIPLVTNNSIPPVLVRLLGPFFPILLIGKKGRDASHKPVLPLPALAGWDAGRAGSGEAQGWFRKQVHCIGYRQNVTRLESEARRAGPNNAIPRSFYRWSLIPRKILPPALRRPDDKSDQR